MSEKFEDLRDWIEDHLKLVIIVGVIEGVFVNSYAGIFYNRVFGSIYREAIK